MSRLILSAAAFLSLAACSITPDMRSTPLSSESTQSGSACDLQVAATEKLFEVPFRVVDGRIYVDVKVASQGPFPFAVDTGAGGLGRADMLLVDRLDLASVGEAGASDGVSVETAQTVKLTDLDIGGHVTPKMEVMARDYSSRMAPENAIFGILGREFFGQGTLVIDYPARKVSFVQAAKLKEADTGFLSYERAFRVPLLINGKEYEANLDTGANVEMVMPQTLLETLSSQGTSEAPAATLTNNSIRTTQGTVKGPFRLGEAEFADITVRGSDKFREIMVGARVLQDYRILIDQPSARVAICR